MRTMNAKERLALLDLVQRHDPANTNASKTLLPEYRTQRRNTYYSNLNGCWLTQWCGMTVGIEADGYTHT